MDADTVQTISPWILALATGMAYVGLAFAVYLTFRILDFPDLTVNGSLSLGAVVSTALITVQHWNPWLALLAAVLGGMGAGLITGFLHTTLRINGLLASILVTLGFYSINLRLLGGRSNTGLTDQPTVFNGIQPGNAGVPGVGNLLEALGPLGGNRSFQYFLLMVVLIAVLMGLAYWWLNSEQGLALRATGDNPQMIRALGVSTDWMKLIGLAVANGAAGLTGALLTQSIGFYDISLGSDAIIIGLAGVILGEAVLHSSRIHWALTGLVLGSLIYQLARTAVLSQQIVDVQPTDLQVATALLVVGALSLPLLRGQLRLRGAQPTPEGRTP
jgi:putative ABC transport system permease protein